MIDFLAGVPGKLKTLIDRLTSTWAAKLDTLHDTRLTVARAGYLDKLNLAGKATDDATWTNARAAYLDNINRAPTSAGAVTGPGQRGETTASSALYLARQFPVVAGSGTILNVSGRGVCTFLACMHATNTGSTSFNLIIDGTTIMTVVVSTGYGVTAMIGGLVAGDNGDANYGATYAELLSGVPCEQIRFETSLQVTSSSANGVVFYKYWLGQ